ncbi:DAHL domain-containing protein [Caldimonas brevitalea]|uniref:histidine kinase n=1 Tax=Caldimonas brevitalea TaxID=413882 RepID=A0A0G3BN04_9BURK|nr:DAHL domain-containing protein [Caldimonas brevitalea]AKJ29363.1 sensor histidine kinase [Caldimonas brevitalea]
MRSALALGVLALLGAGWVYLYTLSHSADPVAHARTIGLVRHLRQLDSDWSAEVLRAQADLAKSYDALARPLPALDRLLRQLETQATGWDEPRLRGVIESIKSAVQTKTELVDEFKSQHALLKNSLHYLTTAVRDPEAAAHDKPAAAPAAADGMLSSVPGVADALERSVTLQATQPDATPGSSAVAAALRRKLAAARRTGTGGERPAIALVQAEDVLTPVVQRALRYHTTPDSAGAAGLQQALSRLRARLAADPAAWEGPMGNTLVHAEAILELRERQPVLLRQIASVPLAARLDKLADDLETRFDAQVARQSAYTRGLWVYSALLLALAVGAAGVLIQRHLGERRRLAALVERQARELKDNEAQLVHAQKMNALGELVAGLAHEVTTPLAAVRSGLQNTHELMATIAAVVGEAEALSTAMAQPKPADEAGRDERNAELTRRVRRLLMLREDLVSFDALDTVDQLLQEGMRSVDHIGQLVLNMLDFSRLNRGRIARVRVEDGIERMLAMARHLLGKIEVQRDFGQTEPVECDLAQINQVLLNLLRNAAQVLQDRDGRVVVRTRMHSPTQLSISVLDNGPGIAPDVLPKIWQPFYTTRPHGVGAGLGLSTSRKIVEAHGGSIFVRSQPGEGSEFIVLLPTVAPASLRHPPRAEVLAAAA